MGGHKVVCGASPREIYERCDRGQVRHRRRRRRGQCDACEQASKVEARPYGLPGRDDRVQAELRGGSFGHAAAREPAAAARVRRPHTVPALWASLQRPRGRAAHPEVPGHQCEAQDAHARRWRPGGLLCVKAEVRQLVCVAGGSRLYALRRRDDRCAAAHKGGLAPSGCPSKPASKCLGVCRRVCGRVRRDWQSMRGSGVGRCQVCV